MRHDGFYLKYPVPWQLIHVHVGDRLTFYLMQWWGSAIEHWRWENRGDFARQGNGWANLNGAYGCLN